MRIHSGDEGTVAVEAAHAERVFPIKLLKSNIMFSALEPEEESEIKVDILLR